MLGYFLCRAILMVFGYAYPAYKCFKTVETQPETEKLLSWCHYWIIVAVLTVLERIMDFSISWLPMYGEAKLALFIYIWCSQMEGAEYLYNTILKPLVKAHEEEIDKGIGDVKAKAGNVAAMYWGRTMSVGQNFLSESFRSVSSLSALQPYLNPPPPATQDHDNKQNEATQDHDNKQN